MNLYLDYTKRQEKMNDIFNVPDYIKTINNRLITNGYKSFLVGGCVRNTLLNLDIKDYDITTNCEISVLKSIFSDYKIINSNGEKHNTISLYIEGDIVEITSYKHTNREENSLENDLKHRDLTINSIAYSINLNTLVDLNLGYNDLNNKIIRFVGNPIDRIKEDPLRILRALRFSSVLGFEIEDESAKAIHKCKDLLNKVSNERIKSELDKIIVSNNIKSVLLDYKDVIFTIIPELKLCDAFDQKNPYHANTLYNHIVNVCCNVYSKNNAIVENIRLTRTAALFHDIGKTMCFTLDGNGIGHFYGHAEKSASIALDIMKRLKYSNEETQKIEYLIKRHDATINLTKKSVRKNLSNVVNCDLELFLMLIELMNSDRLDHTHYELIDIQKIKDIIKDLKEDNECIKVSQLALNGYDLINLGLQGKEIGDTLNYLLELVLDGKLCNTKQDLLEFVKNKKIIND